MTRGRPEEKDGSRRRLGKLAAAFVIGRRDYSATVLSRSFLLFLLGPLFPVLLGVLFGGIGAGIASDAERSAVTVIAAPADFARLTAARGELAVLPAAGRLPDLVRAEPGSDPARLLGSAPPSRAILADPFGTPRLTGPVAPDDALIGQLRLLLDRAAPAAGPLPQVALSRTGATEGTARNARELTARIGQTLLFILTIMLAGMLLSQLIEEKSNKVIEVLAAAVPVESIFIGKLFAMLCVSLTGIVVWSSVAIVTLVLLAPGAVAALPAPAVGWPLFALLAALYFAMSYLLIGAAFLGIGAQAASAREVQTLSMPVTMVQIGLFALASFAVEDPGGTGALAAAIFPLSSPLAMISRAALEPAFWPHLVALAWQALWIALILKFAAAWFRRSVLSSGGARKRWWRRSKPSTA